MEITNSTFIRYYSRVAWLIIFGMVLLFFDFFSKAYIYYLLPLHDAVGHQFLGIPVFHFLGIDFWISIAMNKGAAWGLFADFQIVLLLVRTVVIFGMFFYLFFLNSNRRAHIPIVLIIAGAIGNVVDFFLYGFVIDFLFFSFWGYHFPVFNFADTFITIGVGWLFLSRTQHA